MKKQYEILMDDAYKAKDEGHPQHAIDLAGMAVCEAAKEFGKYSMQTCHCVLFMTQTSLDSFLAIVSGNAAFEYVEMKDEFRDSNLKRAAEYHCIASEIIEELKEDSYFSLLCDYLGANIYNSDKENVIGEHFGYSREDIKKIAKGFFADCIKKGGAILKNIDLDYCHNTAQSMVSDSYSMLKELGVKFDKGLILERHFKKDEEGFYLRAYLDLDTNKVFFNGDDVCKSVGVTHEKAIKHMDEKDYGSLSSLGFIV